MRQTTTSGLRKPLTAALCIVLVASTSACQTTGGGASTSAATVSEATYTADEQRLREQGTDITGTVVEGAVIGAVLGGVIGLLAGGNKRSAAIGAGAGSLAGAAAGYYVGKRQAYYASEEARLDAMIADVRADNERIEAYLATAREVIAADKARIAEIERQYAAKQITLAEGRDRLERVAQNRDVMQETVAALRKKRDQYRDAAEQTRRDSPGTDTSEMDRQIALLEQNVNQLEGEIDALNVALSVSAVG